MTAYNQGDARQLIQTCTECHQDTDRCEDDSIYIDGPCEDGNEYIGPLCLECYHKIMGDE